jgi:hypothetical protein
MDHESAFGSVNKLTDFGALGLIDRKEAMRVIVLFTEISEEFGQSGKLRRG